MILGIVLDRQAVPRSDDGAPVEDDEGSPLQLRGQQSDRGRQELPDSLRHPRQHQARPPFCAELGRITKNDNVQ